MTDPTYGPKPIIESSEPTKEMIEEIEKIKSIVLTEEVFKEIEKGLGISADLGMSTIEISGQIVLAFITEMRRLWEREEKYRALIASMEVHGREFERQCKELKDQLNKMVTDFEGCNDPFVVESINEKLEELERKFKASTDGVWVYDKSLREILAHSKGREMDVAIISHEYDAEFVVAAHEIVPLLTVEVRRLETENFALAAGVCTEGNQGLIGSEGGTPYCAMKERAENAESDRDRYKSAIPDTCPITGMEYFMTIPYEDDFPDSSRATYGGPLDSYTIPTVDSLEVVDEKYRCGRLSRERYDQDEGAWVEGSEVLDLCVVGDEIFSYIDDLKDQIQRISVERDQLRVQVEELKSRE